MPGGYECGLWRAWSELKSQLHDSDWVLLPLWSHFAHLVILCPSWVHSHSAEVITALFICEKTPSKDLSSGFGAGSKEKMQRLKKVIGLSQKEVLDILERDVKSGVGLDLWPKQLHWCLLWKEREINQSVKLFQSLGRVVIALQVTGETSLNVEKLI